MIWAYWQNNKIHISKPGCAGRLDVVPVVSMTPYQTVELARQLLDWADHGLPDPKTTATIRLAKSSFMIRYYALSHLVLMQENNLRDPK